MNKGLLALILFLTVGIVGAAGFGLVKLHSSQTEQAGTEIASNSDTSQNQVVASTIPDIVSTANAQSCTTPDAPQNVTVDYPSCQGTQCSFTDADCNWGAVSGAANYSVKVTEVDSNTVVKNTTVSSGTTYTFPVTQNKTYRCDVSAVNSCGTAGAAGSGQALCAVDGLTVSTAPSATPVVTPTPVPVACGMSCTSTTDCQSGLTCLKLANGTGYCANPAYQQACLNNPSVNSCCQAPPKPTPPPVLPKSGLLDNTVTISVIGVVFLGAAAAMMIL